MSIQTTRRYFFFGSLMAGAMPSGGFGSVASLKALGHKPYYEKLNVAAIGVGGRGGEILRQAAATENIVALCDVDVDRAAPSMKRFENVPVYPDFRTLLDKAGKNIDAVTIAVPDFMHATVALACMQAGKHVYLEKPLTRTPWEARLLADAAVKYKVATQMGNQGYSHESHRVAAEILWSGEIGDVEEVHISATPGTHPTGLQEAPPEQSVPRGLNWQAWLGNARMRPFSSYYVPYNWRGFYDFGTGQIGNWATHTAGPAHHALQLGAPATIERTAVAGESKITYPDRAVVRLDFPARGKMPAVRVFYHDSARVGDAEAFVVPGMENEVILPPPDNLADKGRVTAPPRTGPPPQPRPANAPRQGAGGPGVAVFGPPRGESRRGVLTGNGSVFIGTKGIMATCDRGEGVWLLPSARWAEYKLPQPLLTRSPGHMLDWIRACKGGDPACSDFRIAGPFAEWLALAAISLRVGGKLNWDAKLQRFTNSAEANKYVKPDLAPGWELKL
jgi:predicted dehydrogenase